MTVFKQKSEIRPLTAETESGSFIKKNYIIRIDRETGHKIIEENGSINTWLQVQASKDRADINSIIERYTRGDLSGWKDPEKGLFADFTGIPDNMIEIANMRLKAQKQWNALPLEIRREYNHDVDTYFADIGSEKWLKIHGLMKEEPELDDIGEITPVNPKPKQEEE